MASWFSISLGDAMLADAALASLREGFLTRCDDVAGAAIYLRHESEGRLHCELVAYFPPSCADLARAFAARPCARPDAEGLSLFTGHDVMGLGDSGASA